MTDRFTTWVLPDIEDGKPTRWHWVVQNTDNFTLGKYTDIGAFTYINAKYDVVISDNVQIGSHCSIYSISTIDNKTGPVLIKENAKVGSHTVIMPGVTIGENTIVGAHSFVNRDLPANVVAVGCPAKIVKTLTEDK